MCLCTVCCPCNEEIVLAALCTLLGHNVHRTVFRTMSYRADLNFPPLRNMLKNVSDCHPYHLKHTIYRTCHFKK